MTEIKGRFTLVLHSHLPYVLSHGRWPHGTDWLTEAAAECYIPLIRVLERLLSEGITPNVTLGLTPILCEQLSSPAFVAEFEDYLETKIQTAAEDEKEFSQSGRAHLAKTAKMWTEFYTGIKRDFDGRYERDLVGTFSKLQQEGAIEIITCAATHGYLPLLGTDQSVAAQVKTGVETYKKHFGMQPAGIWLPECAYRPAYKWTYPIEGMGEAFERAGIEEFLYDNGLVYFIVDHHLLEGGKAVGAYADRFEALKKLWDAFSESYTQVEGQGRSPYRSYFVTSRERQSKAVAVLVRDPKTGVQVWSGEHGYPGDGQYLDFHKKHFPGGNRYWRVTSAKADLGDKLEYEPELVQERIKENAGHFKDLIKSIIEKNYDETDEPCTLCAPYDAELFGHWWFEGPEFLYYALKWISMDPEIETVTGKQQLELSPPKEALTLPEGSWGEGGYHYIWLNEFTQWTWKHIYKAEKRFLERLDSVDWKSDETARRILLQQGRELLLMEGSDWQFLISTWSARDYAETRITAHSDSFNDLDDVLVTFLKNKSLDEKQQALLTMLEERDCPFADLDLSWWTK